MKRLNFDEFVTMVNGIDAPNQRLGIFNVKINNCHKRYEFHKLKVTASNNPNITGFSLNHYGWFAELPKQNFKKSRFHDDEDVCIHIERSEFDYAYKVNNFQEISVITKNFSLQINW